MVSWKNVNKVVEAVLKLHPHETADGVRLGLKEVLGPCPADLCADESHPGPILEDPTLEDKGSGEAAPAEDEEDVDGEEPEEQGDEEEQEEDDKTTEVLPGKDPKETEVKQPENTSVPSVISLH